MLKNMHFETENLKKSKEKASYELQILYAHS